MPPMASSPVQKQYCERATVLVATALGFAGGVDLARSFCFGKDLIHAEREFALF